MDYEEVGNLTNGEDVTPEQSSTLLTQEVVFCLFCLVAACADSFIIYVTFRFKRMRTVPNIFLANWAITDLFTLIVTPSSYRIVSVISHRSISSEFLCILEEVGASLHVMTLWFAILVAMDWCIAAYFHKASEKFRSHYRFVLAAMWILALLFNTTTVSLCISRRFRASNSLVLFSNYCALLILVIVLQCSRAVQKCRGKLLEHPSLMLTLVTAFAASWFLGLLGFITMGFTNVYHVALEVLATCAIFCCSIVTFLLLYSLNEDFQACFLQVLRRSNNKYEEADFDFANPLVASSFRKPIVRVSYHKDQELLVN